MLWKIKWSHSYIFHISCIHITLNLPRQIYIHTYIRLASKLQVGDCLFEPGISSLIWYQHSYSHPPCWWKLLGTFIHKKIQGSERTSYSPRVTLLLLLSDLCGYISWVPKQAPTTGPLHRQLLPPGHISARCLHGLFSLSLCKCHLFREAFPATSL